MKIRENNKKISTSFYVDPPYKKQLSKLNDNDFFIPETSEFLEMCKYNYRVVQLKKICKHYNLKLTGTKNELFNQAYNYLRLSYYTTKIQKISRGILLRKCINYQGPALFKRDKCVNDCDFYTLQKINEIPHEQFFSFKDVDNFIYGFDIISIYTLFNVKNQRSKKHENPYNRNLFPKFVKRNLVEYLSICKCLNIKVNNKDEEECDNIKPEKKLEFKALELFQHIDHLGNYTNPRWFLSLDRTQLIMYVRELYDIWTYRANLQNSIKMNICPPTGDPFRGSNLLNLSNNSLIDIQNSVLQIMSRFVKSGHTTDNQSLGAFYVLAALTLVNSEAAESLPWLFQSVSHIN